MSSNMHITHKKKLSARSPSLPILNYKEADWWDLLLTVPFCILINHDFLIIQIFKQVKKIHVTFAMHTY